VSNWNRTLNARGISAVVNTVRDVCGISGFDTDERVLTFVSERCGGNDCGLTRLEVDGEIEIPRHLTRDRRPFLLTASANWFDAIADEEAA
jgi:hypothetical protein